MTKQRGYARTERPSEAGYTLIELLIMVGIIGTLVSCLGYAFSGPQTECVGGFTYIQQIDGHYHQVIGANGGGVPCKP